MTEVTVPAAPPLITIPNVELMHTGQWNLSTGPASFSATDLANAVAALDCPAVRNPVLKLGHTEPDPDEQKQRWDGEPAVGYISNMAVVESGQTLVGDYTGMPGWMTGEVLASAYPDRSIEGQWNFRCQIGHTHPFVITAVALLGVMPPGIGTLQSLQDVAALYGVTDSGQVAAAPAADPSATPFTITVHAAREDAVPNPNPAQVRAGVTTDDVRRAFYSSEYGKGWDTWICEIQLGPDLQLIVIDDASGTLNRVPITVGDGDGEDAVTFGEPVKVVVRYEDAPATANAAAGPAVVRYASRTESRPGGPVRAATVSDKPWSDFTESDYDIGQWKRACLIDTGEGDETSKDRYKVPVLEPDGTLNRNGCHAAAGAHGISAVKGISDDDKKAAAKKLVKLYQDELDEDPPESLLKLAGMDDSSANAAAPSRGGTSARPARAAQNPPADPAGASPQEGAAMDAAKLREALGLSPEASDDEVRTALTDNGLAEAPVPAPGTNDPEPEGEPSGEHDTEPAPAEGDGGESPGVQAGAETARPLPPGTVAIDEATLAQLRQDAQQGVEARALQRTQERDRFLDDAIRAGKFPPARREHWATYWDRDEEGARAAIASLADGLVPVTDLGEPGGEPDASAALDAEFDRLFPPAANARS